MNLLAASPVVTRWISEPDDGIYDAWNKGVAMARGEWIMFLGADDRLPDAESLMRWRPVLARAKNDGLAYVHGTIAKTHRGRIVGRQSGAIDIHRRLALPAHPGSMHHRSLFERHGNFDPTFRMAGDLEFLSRELVAKPSLYCPEITTALVELGGLTNRPGFEKVMFAELAEIQKRRGLTHGAARLRTLYFMMRCRTIVWRALGPRLGAYVVDGIRLCIGKPRLWTR